MNSVLIKNGWLTTSSDSYKGDVFIVDEKIVLLGTELNEDADIIIDASNKFVFPGGIDAHVHMDVPCSDGSMSAGYVSETLAAAVGGTTTILDYVLQEKGQTLSQSFADGLKKAAGTSAIDFGFQLIITNPDEESLQEIKSLAAQGITSFKLFMANDIALRDYDLVRFMEELAKNGCTACIHAENKDIIAFLQKRFIENGQVEPFYHAITRPAQTETEAINRVISIAALTGCPTLIAHISTEQGLKQVGEAKKRGLVIYGETCPHYLLLSEENYKQGDFESAKYVLSPPLRSKENQKGLWHGVIGPDVDIVSSDHNGFSYSTHKQLGRQDFREIPNGAPGIEHRFSLMFHFGREHGIAPSRFVEIVSTNPAKIFGLYPRKGTIAPGSDADLVIFDPEAEQVISAESQHQLSDYTPYEQFRLRGKVETVLQRGQVIVKDGKFIGRPGMGKYLKRVQKTSERILG